MARVILYLMAACLPLLLIAAEEKVDLSVINRIKSEAFENSKVMEHMFYLTDVHGPRLTGSPGYKAAADWVVEKMTAYGLRAKEEKWGPFGRGWTTKHFEAHMIELQSLRDAARAAGQLSAAITAEVKRGELMRFYTKQVESARINEFSHMSNEELEAFIWDGVAVLRSQPSGR